MAIVNNGTRTLQYFFKHTIEMFWSNQNIQTILLVLEVVSEFCHCGKVMKKYRKLFLEMAKNKT